MATYKIPANGVLLQPMRIQARDGSRAEKYYYAKSALPSGVWAIPKASAPGISPAPLDDLMFHGGRVIPQMEFQNVFIGGTAAWQASDVANIDVSIDRAMRDRRLNNVMTQYFPGAKPSCDMRASIFDAAAKPAAMDEDAVKAKVVALYDGGKISKKDPGTTVFNLVLPSDTLLRLDGDSSLHGLGGYHGSVHITRAGRKITLYYSANVYSEVRADGRENGIAVFNRPWKNVVGTLYHEINEFRTDPDVGDAIATGQDHLLGWSSRRGHEVGDQPIFKAGAAENLGLVFKEVTASVGTRKLPVQFMYSNAVHGAEGPVAKARP